VETLTYSSGRASGCDSPGLLNYWNLCRRRALFHVFLPQLLSARFGRTSCAITCDMAWHFAPDVLVL